MWKGAIVGAFALATIGTSIAAAENLGIGAEHQTASAEGPVVTSADISRFKAALRLRAEQESYWAPVEAALREVAQQQAHEGANSGRLARWGARLAAITLNSQALRRLAVAARPLIKALDEDQKRVALAAARAMGFGHVASAF
jgi:hypothetical protein